MRFVVLLPLLLFTVVASGAAAERVVDVADDVSLRAALRSAEKGTRIRIAPGNYRPGVYVGGLAGTEGSPIVIEGAVADDPPLFEGGSQAWHLSDCSFVTLRNVAVRGQSSNGINVDDGGSFDTPSHHVVLEKLRVADVGPAGNHDPIKLSGVDDFVVRNVTIEGWGGQAVDMVGCHRGVIEACRFRGKEGFSQSAGPQTKGGSSEIVIRGCLFDNAAGRAVNLGGSTGMPYFRPRGALYEAKDITVEGCTFVGGQVRRLGLGGECGLRRRAMTMNAHLALLPLVTLTLSSTCRADDMSATNASPVGRVEVQLKTDSKVAQQRKPSDRYAGLHGERYFAQPEVRRETDVAFLEGPACDRQGNVFFTNVPAERILRWDPAARKLSVFRHPSNAANGLAFDRRGRLLACEGGAGRVTRTDLETGQIEVLIDQYQGKPVGKPNDLALDAKGRIYFTSRFGGNLEPGQVNGVYRIDPDGRSERILATPEVDMPNGIVTSPDDRALYLIDADGRQSRARRIRAYALKPDGTVAGERLLFDFYPGRSGDGMAIDAEGNLYVAAGLHRRRGSSETLDTRPGIHVISPSGKLLAFVETPEDTVTNCTFGGLDLKILYVTCGKKLLSIRTRIPGKPLYRPQGSD
ncbi:MAG: SMP-30/gluconolactonase/LRE family protein [Planctomycetota bacterium]